MLAAAATGRGRGRTRRARDKGVTVTRPSHRVTTPRPAQPDAAAQQSPVNTGTSHHTQADLWLHVTRDT